MTGAHNAEEPEASEESLQLKAPTPIQHQARSRLLDVYQHGETLHFNLRHPHDFLVGGSDGDGGNARTAP